MTTATTVDPEYANAMAKTNSRAKSTDRVAISGTVVTTKAAAKTATHPYMRRWVSIYSPRKKLQKLCPDRFYGDIGMGGIREAAARRNVEFLWVGTAARRVTVPVFMIHGEADTYIKPDMAKALFRRVRTPEKQLWLVPKAKHNQAPQIAPEEYHKRLVDFFDDHLGDIRSPQKSTAVPMPVPVDANTPVPAEIPSESVVTPGPRLTRA